MYENHRKYQTPSTKTLLACALLIFFSVTALGRANAATSVDLDEDSRQALQTLYRTHPLAKSISSSAQAILIFPNVVKAGFVFGGSYGEGELRKGSTVIDYYNTVGGSWGLQIGAQSYSYAIFLMTDKAVNYLKESKGWEIGIGPTVVVVDEGISKNLSTTSLQGDAYAFIYSQQGLMAGISVEGTKITKIER
jgi:lipid-binding SYLF domain-containing protein